MRVTNEVYPRGSVIVPRIPSNSDRAYLDGRPMIVISQLPLMNSLTCIECTSRDRPGIEISLFQHHTGKFNADAQYGIACPYAVHDIPVKQIIDYLGVVNPITMQAINSAVAWHMGLSDVIPPYMEQIIQEEYAPVYNMGTAANTALNIAHGLCSSMERNRKFAKIAMPECPGVPYTKNQPVPVQPVPAEEPEVIEYDPNKMVHDWAAAFLVADPEAFTPTQSLLDAYLQSTKDDGMHIIGFSNRLGRILSTQIPIAKRMRPTKGPYFGKSGFSGVSIVGEPVTATPFSDIVSARVRLYDSMTPEDKFAILVHRIKAGDTYSDMTLSADDITWLTRRILDSHGYCNNSFTSDLVRGIENQHYHWSFIDADKVAALMLFGNWDQIKPSAFMKLQTRFVYIIQTERLDFSDLRKWPKIVNGRDLKVLANGGGGQIWTLRYPLKLIQIFWKPWAYSKKKIGEWTLSRSPLPSSVLFFFMRWLHPTQAYLQPQGHRCRWKTQ